MAEHDWVRVPVVVSFPEVSAVRETYGFTGSQGMVVLEGQLLRPPAPSSTLFLFMHPATTLQMLPMPAAMADAGLHVLCAGSRYARNDSALIMEKVAADLGAYIRHAREALGYRTVVLVGWSGGGALSLFYQAQAEQPTITHTPAGDPYDLTAAALPKADGIIFIAAHLSRAETLTEWIDPSVLDEANPDRRDPEFDIYAADARHRPPYDPAFVAAFRARQQARNGKITAWAQEMIETLRRRGTPEIERPFIVHRTMCDVRWLDSAVDPNGREPGWCYLGDPRAANVGPVGLARYTTLRSFLSQWSYELSNARGPANAARIRTTPVLQIENGADDAVPATHNPAIRAALATPNKAFVRIEGATHYYKGQPAQMQACLDAVLAWVRSQSLLD